MGELKEYGQARSSLNYLGMGGMVVELGNFKLRTNSRVASRNTAMSLSASTGT